MNPTPLPPGAATTTHATTTEEGLAMQVQAFVDGELADDEATAFARRLADDPALARAVDEARALNELLRGAWNEVLGEPVPASLLAVIAVSPADAPADIDRRGTPGDAANDATPPLTADPVSLADARASRRPPAWRLPEWIGLAAALLLGVQAGRLATSGAPAADAARPAVTVAASGDLRAAAPLAAALESAPGGATVGATTLGLSFRTADGTPCRSFTAGAEVRTEGIACKREGAWDVAWLSRTAGPGASPPRASGPGVMDDGGYRTAASPMDAALLARIDAMRAGDTFDAKAEADARARGWTRSR